MTKRGLVKFNIIGHSAKHRYSRCIPFWLTSVILLGLNISMAVGAATYISQSYSTSDKLSLGSIVSLKSDSTDQVAAAASNNVDGLLGVVVNKDNSLLSLSGGGENQVSVATTGTLPVLVSDINGAITRGDQITASPISGVGMKATGNIMVLGTAQGDLSSVNGAQQSSYVDKNGKKQSVILGQIPVIVNVSYYFKQPDKTLVPAALQNLANNLAGKNVSTLPIIISGAIFIITIIVVVSIIYSMIRSSIISVGRNPMSQSAIYRDLIQLSALVLAILALGIIAIYLVLTRM